MSMKYHQNIQPLAGLLAGFVLGAGLLVSGMTDPGKVLGFLDIGSNWNPSLMGVLGGAVMVSLLGFSLAKNMKHPWFDSQFYAPTKKEIDKPLVIGGLMFGIGWGLAGYCPGPALAGLALGNPEAPVFVGAMLLGGVLQNWWATRNQ